MRTLPCEVCGGLWCNRPGAYVLGSFNPNCVEGAARCQVCLVDPAVEEVAGILCCAVDAEAMRTEIANADPAPS